MGRTTPGSRAASWMPTYDVDEKRLCVKGEREDEGRRGGRPQKLELGGERWRFVRLGAIGESDAAKE